jgi:hypothetical protein
MKEVETKDTEVVKTNKKFYLLYVLQFVIILACTLKFAFIPYNNKINIKRYDSCFGECIGEKLKCTFRCYDQSKKCRQKCPKNDTNCREGCIDNFRSTCYSPCYDTDLACTDMCKTKYKVY